MANFLLSRKFLIILVVLATFTFVISLFTRRDTPRVVDSNPIQNGTKFSVYESPTINFDRKMAISDISIRSNPKEDWNIIQNTTDSITLDHKLYLQVNVQYQLDVLYKNRIIYTLNFTTKPEQNDPRYLQGIQESMDHDYPLATKLPHEAPGYRLTYNSPLTIKISLKKSTITQEEALSYARDWVKEQGMEPSTHKYVVSDTLYVPSPTPTGILENRSTTTPTPSPTSTEIDWDNLQDDGT